MYFINPRNGRGFSSHRAALAAAAVRRNRRAGTHRPHAEKRDSDRSHRTRVSFRRSARDREDDDGAHLREGAQLHERSERFPAGRRSDLPRHRRRFLSGRHGNRRGDEPQRRRREADPRGMLLPADAVPLQNLHHRRSSPAFQGRLQRAAQSHRGAAGIRQVHLRDDGGGQSSRNDHVALSALRISAHPRRENRRAAAGNHGKRRRGGRPRRAHRHRAPRQRRDARFAVDSRPSHFLLREKNFRTRRRGHLRARLAAGNRRSRGGDGARRLRGGHRLRRQVFGGRARPAARSRAHAEPHPRRAAGFRARERHERAARNAHAHGAASAHARRAQRRRGRREIRSERTREFRSDAAEGRGAEPNARRRFPDSGNFLARRRASRRRRKKK